MSFGDERSVVWPGCALCRGGHVFLCAAKCFCLSSWAGRWEAWICPGFPPAPHCLDKKRLLAGVAGIMAPQWLIKRKQNRSKPKKATRVGLSPSVLLLILPSVWQRLFPSQPNWPASHHSLANAHSPGSHFCVTGSKEFSSGDQWMDQTCVYITSFSQKHLYA